MIFMLNFSHVQSPVKSILFVCFRLLITLIRNFARRSKKTWIFEEVQPLLTLKPKT